MSRNLKKTDFERTIKNQDEKEKLGENEKVKFTQQPIFFDNEIMWEIVYDGTTTEFVAWNGFDDFEYEEKFQINENEFVIPIMDDSVKTGAVILPEKPEKFDKIEDLVKEIQEHIHKYCDLSEDYEIFATYYILLSWIYDKVNTLPYLRVMGDTGTGKSRFLDVVGKLCYKASIVSGAITPAPIYRMIKKWKGTVIIDEADFRESSEKNEVITILNCGFERGKPVIRCVKDKPNDLEYLPTFCPKVLSTRKTFFDKALESRCLTEIMKETDRKDIPPLLPKSYEIEQKTIRNKLLFFRLKYYDKINTDNIEKIDIGDVEPRLKQVTSSFTILFVNIKNLFERFKIFIEKYQKELIEERSNTFEGIIINAIFDLLNIKKLDDIEKTTANPPTSSDISNYMNEKEKPKKEYNPRTIGRALKSLGLKTKLIREGKNVKRPIIFDENIMKKLFRRYVTRDVTNVTEVTSVTSVRYSPLKNSKLESQPDFNNKKSYIVYNTDVTNVTTLQNNNSTLSKNSSKEDDEWIKETKSDGRVVWKRKKR